MKPTLNEQAKQRLIDNGYAVIGHFWGKISDRDNSNAQRFIGEWIGRYAEMGVTASKSDFRFEAGAKNPYGTARVYVGVSDWIQQLFLTTARKEAV
jgi:hypothetical protein